MYNTVEDLLSALRATPETLPILLRGYDGQPAGPADPGSATSEDAWSVAQVLCHLRDVEERGIERMRQIRDLENPVLPAYDQAALAVERNYAGTRLQDALAGFLRFRAVHLAELAALQPGAWERGGRHAEMGQIDITGHTLHLVSHDAVHLAQIARQLP